MAKTINAVDVVFSIKRPTDTNPIILGCTQTATFTKRRAMDSATCSASDGHAQFSPGQKSWDGSVTALLRDFDNDEADENISLDDVLDMLDEGTEITVNYARKVGGRRYTGNAFVSEVTYTQPETGSVTWSANLTGQTELLPVTPTV
ncbi:hypothetical protein GCM10027048_27720 [Hymenobacter coalescens]